MKNRFMGNKAVIGLLAVLMAGVSGVGVASDDRSEKEKKAINYDEMVLIPAGKFIFGNPGHKKEISLPAFMIDKYEVTNRQYAKFNLDHRYEPVMANFPVIMVSHYDAINHCDALDKRLPTEQEWEKAARGTDGRIYPWGNEFDVQAAVTNETDFEGHPLQPLAVGAHKKGKSPYGVMDMAGNVWEWTHSYDERYVILKGGSFFEDRNNAKTTSTLRSIPDDSKDYVGFRCVKDVEKRP
ncbi:MAG TPA: formylglycine-generating enzyme family protein [Candidatus Wunengus sp. YC61]|uniref:formylglycine-generating enzyme family protein n=1 Tax=Candidatus Wunengus sp. YC61 TaxID=3367698 RepID=UPI004028DD01